MLQNIMDSPGQPLVNPNVTVTQNSTPPFRVCCRLLILVYALSPVVAESVMAYHLIRGLIAHLTRKEEFSVIIVGALPAQL